MRFSDDLTFSVRDWQDLYDYVERHGTVEYEEARRALGMDPTMFGHYVAVLKRQGVLVRDGDTLRIAFEDDGEERFRDPELDVEYVIRQAEESDIDTLMPAIHESLAGGNYVLGETVAAIVDREHVLLRHNELESRVFFVAVVGDRVVGWVHLDVPEVDGLDHTAELTVGVCEGYRGHGVGSHLLERGLAWAETKGIERVYNSVPATNESAIEWLETRGWTVEAVREDHYRIDGEHVDEVMMAAAP